MWVVKLTKPLPLANPFRANFFPREFHYKKDAQALVKEVEREGGKATVEKAK